MNETQVLAIMRKILEEPRERTHTGGRAKIEDEVKTHLLAVRIEQSLFEELKSRQLNTGVEVERALKIFLRILDVERKR